MTDPGALEAVQDEVKDVSELVWPLARGVAGISVISNLVGNEGIRLDVELAVDAGEHLTDVVVVEVVGDLLCGEATDVESDRVIPEIAQRTTAFAMLRACIDDVAVYTASLQEWAADPDNPMEIDDATGAE